MKNFINYIKENNGSDYNCDLDELNYDINDYFDCVKKFIKENGVNAITINDNPILLNLIFDYDVYSENNDEIKNGLIVLIKELINDNNIDLNYSRKDNQNTQNMLMATCSLQDVDSEIIKELLNAKKIDINELDSFNNNALMWLAPDGEIWNLNRFIEVLNLLIDAGININQRNNYNNNFLSMLISTEITDNDVTQLLPILKILLKNGLKLDIGALELIDCVYDNEEMLELTKEYDNELYKEYEVKKNTRKYKI